MLNVACFRWGDWPAYYVDRLRESVAKHLTLPHRFHCIEDAPDLPGNLRRSWMFSRACGLRGRVLVLDLDMVITGSLDEMASYDGQFCVLEDLWEPGLAGGGMIAFNGGDLELERALWRPIADDLDAVMAATNGRERFWFRRQIPRPDFWQSLYPGQIVDAKPQHGQIIEQIPDGTRVACFHGNPRPHEVDIAWVREHWGGLMPIEFRSDLNTPTSEMIEQASRNLARGLPLMEEQAPHDGIALLVGGGPSLADTAHELQMRQADGGVIFALNGAHDWLIERGIIPDVLVMLDARAENAQFVQRSRDDVTYLIAAQCHPDVFDALEGRSVLVWLGCFEHTEQENTFAANHPEAKMFVAGGATVGMKAMHLAHLLGYREQHLFGFDSSYQGEANHAYVQDMNNGEARIEVTAGARKFTCAPWMAKQAMEFQSQARNLLSLGCSIEVHGDGLLPHVAALMNGESNASHAR